MSRKKAIVIGAGIAGLATARALATRNYAVTIIERSGKAVGASVRNFGMIWPIGQPDGILYERALHSKSIWKECCQEAGIWYEEAGSLHMAYHEDEWAVLQELADIYRHRGYQLLSPAQTLSRSPAVVPAGLKGSLYSPVEMIVEARDAIAAVAGWLSRKWNVDFIWGKVVTAITYPVVHMGTETCEADEIYICSGTDFETLYPQRFAAAPLTRCKLQMLRMQEQPQQWRIGPSLCGGLSLMHYTSFKAATTLASLGLRYSHEYAEHLKWGIHVMVSQNATGALTIGDSHEYGHTHDPFDRQFINHLILDYLAGFARFKDETIIQTWSGIYPKLTNGQTELILEPEPGVWIINGLGGAGMTLSFGLCEELFRRRGM
ncbi:TIGR03364 family FAD-dependent oxidoreductase [Niabella sp.]|uniref:TIGR03364 family FAD-dependent oxidoreductase n=1 Tax=Niabella sp. TaxID=1962976 RepID=UPI0026062E04|nr:TIGR03364 family FAD-dependent oxidoreductase [Niabella sp.]